MGLFSVWLFSSGTLTWEQKGVIERATFQGKKKKGAIFFVNPKQRRDEDWKGAIISQPIAFPVYLKRLCLKPSVLEWFYQSLLFTNIIENQGS